MRKAKDKSGRMSAQERLELWQAYKHSDDARTRDRELARRMPVAGEVIDGPPAPPQVMPGRQVPVGGAPPGDPGASSSGPESAPREETRT